MAVGLCIENDDRLRAVGNFEVGRLTEMTTVVGSVTLQPW